MVGASGQDISTGDHSKNVLDSPRSDLAQNLTGRHSMFSGFHQKAEETDMVFSPAYKGAPTPFFLFEANKESNVNYSINTAPLH